ncbi:membrane protein insertase YidC [Aquimarina intermedia]|uniref:Membrane protein insertase YidC n=1 Tax=Aquimarina intermedia TaxID=350814 RepID=A0A5S5BTX1_9FLAO|nr:membrane protein insertase YidC [Aquimarina intermedia]TYP70467.1 protein translocase subunit yidC [Aquimarina intermedia]
MEEKKFDFNSIIGFVLIGVILVWLLYQNQPTQEELEAEKAKQEQIDAQNVQDKPAEAEFVQKNEALIANPQDSTAIEQAKTQLGAFAYSAGLPSAKEAVTTIENEVLRLKIDNRGGYISEALLKNFKTYDSVPVYLIKDGKNASLNLNFGTTDNRILNTSDLFFEPTVSKNGETTVLTMRLKVSDSKFLEYRYELKPNEYMIDFSIRSQGLQGVINSRQPITLDWKLQGIRHAKSASYENRYTELHYEYEGDKDDYLGQGEFTDDEEEAVSWIAYKQHFFSSILLTNTPFTKAKFTSKNVAEIKDLDDKDVRVTKEFSSTMPLELQSGELNYAMNWYYGPTDYKILSDYNKNLDEIVPLGWGIFGWINRYLFIPFFAFLSSFLPSYGIAIIVMTIIVRIVLSPVTYKSYVSQAKMKVLKPEINEINEKHKDNAMKRQQETMALYSKAGASPMSGCLPALMQIPVFYALFNFFPSAFQLRQKSFLWADDLSSYDTIAELPFNIPFYGDHISLFPILASIAIFIYMMMTTGQNMQTQPGMPNMKFIMYLSPLMMLFFFNNYASGLSLYYFVSNLITIGIMLVIKNVIIDDEKIHARIQENKKKPKKQSKFQQKMKEMMEQAEQQKKKK